MKLNELIAEYDDYEIKDLDAVKAMLERPKPKTVRDLKVGDRYGFLSLMGNYQEISFKDDEFDKCVIKMGKAFLTEEDAIKQRKHDEIHEELKRLAGGYEFVFGLDNWFLNVVAKSDLPNDREVVILKDVKFKGNEVYFESSRAAINAIKAIRKERLLRNYFNIEVEEEERWPSTKLSGLESGQTYVEDVGHYIETEKTFQEKFLKIVDKNRCTRSGRIGLGVSLKIGKLDGEHTRTVYQALNGEKRTKNGSKKSQPTPKSRKQSLRLSKKKTGAIIAVADASKK